MRKIPTLFLRDFNARPAHVLPEVTPGCEWVLEGEGTPTRKWDGVCTMLDASGQWWARREVKAGKVAPAGFVAVSTDEETGKTVGWEPMAQTGWAKIHTEALGHTDRSRPGSYELLGPRVNGNPDAFDGHILMPHGWAPFADRLEVGKAPRDFDGLREWLTARPTYEGIVWHRRLGDPDTEMCKLKRRDFPKDPV